MSQAYDLVPLDFTPQPVAGGSVSRPQVVKGNENYDLVELDFSPQDSWQSGSTPFSRLMAMQPAAPPPAPEQSKDGEPWAITRGAVWGMLEQNPQNYADALEALSIKFGNDTAMSASKEVRSWASAPERYKPKVQSMYDIDSISSGLTWMGEAIGQGVASTAPSMATGTAGAVAGGSVAGPPGAVAGGIGGSLASSYPQNLGELYRALVDEGADQKTAADLSVVGAVPISGLDIIPMQRWIGNLTGKARDDAVKGFARRLLKEAKVGAATEFATEGGQSAIKEGIVADATGKDFWTADRLGNILEEAVAGGLTGGAIGAATGVMPSKGEQPAPPPPNTPAGQRNAPQGPEMAPRTGAEGEPSPWGGQAKEQRKTAEQAQADGELTPVDYELVPIDQPGGFGVDPAMQAAEQAGGVMAQQPASMPLEGEYAAQARADEAEATEVPRETPELPNEAERITEEERNDAVDDETDVDSFVTAKGSTYQVSGDKTKRDKAARTEHPGDFGEKDQSARTVYVDELTAKEIGMWMTSSGTNKRVIIPTSKTGKISLVSRPTEDRPIGKDPTIANMNYSDRPKVGLHPVEVFSPSASIKNGYTGVHPGSKIVSIGKDSRRHTAASDISTNSEPVEKVKSPPVGSAVKVFLGNEKEPYFESARVTGYDEAEGRVYLDTPQGTKKWLVNEIRLEPIDGASEITPRNTPEIISPAAEQPQVTGKQAQKNPEITPEIQGPGTWENQGQKNPENPISSDATLRKTLEAVRDKQPIQDQGVRQQLVDEGYARIRDDGSMAILPNGRRKIKELGDAEKARTNQEAQDRWDRDIRESEAEQRKLPPYTQDEARELAKKHLQRYQTDPKRMEVFGGGSGRHVAPGRRDYMVEQHGKTVTFSGLDERFEFPTAQLFGELDAVAAPIQAAKPKVAKASVDDDLLTFLRKNGGIRDDDGEMRARDLHKPTKGVGLIVRKNGRSLDAAREIAEEAGYIPKGSDIQTLLDAIDNQIAGKKAFSGEGLSAAVRDEFQAQADREKDIYESQFESEGERLSIEEQAARIREIDRDAAEAYAEAEKAAAEHLEPDEIHKIEGEPITLQDLENINAAIAEAETVEGERTSVGEQPETAGERAAEGGDSGAEAGPGDRGAEEPLTESTPEGEQSLIPGVKPVTDKDRIKAQSDKPMKGVGEQKPADEGLFDTGARDQLDLVEQAKAPQAKPEHKEIGKNADGDTLYEDENGVRFKRSTVGSTTVRDYEPVTVRPDGTEFVQNPDMRGETWTTVEEVAGGGLTAKMKEDSAKFKADVTKEVFSVQAVNNAARNSDFENFKIEAEKALPLARNRILQRWEKAGRKGVAAALHNATDYWQIPEADLRQFWLQMTEKQKPSAETQQASSDLPKNDKLIILSNDIRKLVAKKLRSLPRVKIWPKDIQEAADKVMGGTMAQGKYDRKDMYDAMELGVNKFVLREGFTPDESIDTTIHRAKQLDDILSFLPTQSVRSEEQVRFQQFSTPPHYSLAAAWVANVGPNDVVLEPSAGTGSLLVHMMGGNPKEVYANELSERRAEMLRYIDGVDSVFTENAEQLNNVLPDSVKPTVVVMNPPFSQTAGRLGDKKDINVGANHIMQALKRLEPGGRLVAIVGRGMHMGAPRFRKWFNDLGKQGFNLRANVGVSGDVYKKYGTHFGTRVLVIDKQPAEGAPIVGDVDSVVQLIKKLEPVRDVRQPAQSGTVEQEGAAERGGDGAPQRGEGAGRAEPDTPSDTGAVGVRAGSARSDTETGGQREPESVPGSDVYVATGTSSGVSGVEPGRGRGAGGKASVSSLGGRGSGKSGKRGADTSGSIQQRPSGEKADTPASGERTGSVEELSLGAAAPGKQRATSKFTESIFEPYTPEKVSIKGAKPHPGDLVQSAAMASVQPPDGTYAPKIPQKLVDDGALSAAQLEAIVYAGQSHNEMLSTDNEEQTPKRRGFFIGDGTGVGKGREIAGIILDNWNRGRKKAVWVSEKKTLLDDAKRDWSGLGQDKNQIFPINKATLGNPLKATKGILFSTYDTLKQGLADQQKIATGSGFVRGQKVQVSDYSSYSGTGVILSGKGVGPKSNPSYRVKLDSTGEEIQIPKNHLGAAEGEKLDVQTRISQIVDWVGKDFDGVIVFDESHNMANAIAQKGTRGIKEASAKALAGIELQDALPNARIVYVSATGATEVYNLAYAERLGLWGAGTPFANTNDFVNKISDGGIAAMELVARDMKALGSYIARNLSYDGVEYERLEHTLNADQREIYDTLAGAWQKVLENINEALVATASDGDGKVDGKARGAAYSAFWGAHQRFFNQIITSMQMPSVIKAVEKDIKEGRQAVLQLVNTNEAAQERAAAKVESKEDIEDLDITPRDQIIQLIERSFPTQQYQEVEDANGNIRMMPVVDSNGNPVQNKEAVAMKERLIDQLASIRVPQGPLDLVLDHFGHETVAEITGRKRRFIQKRDEDGTMRRMEDSRPGSANISETNAFQDGKKKVLIFSQAGGTGRSYHADNNAKSAKARRAHYLVQAGWRADAAIQGFGRTHRTNQASAPIFRLVTTDLRGQKRFISSIARRLSQLGALTKGQRQAGDQGVFSARDNLESTEARDALRAFFASLYHGRIDGLTIDEFEKQTGLRLRDNNGNLVNDLPDITQFLNRLLSMKIDEQNAAFDEFDAILSGIVEERTQNGLIDAGIETVSADKIEKVSQKPVYTDTRSGAETDYVQISLKNKVKALAFTPIGKTTSASSRPVNFYARSKAGKVWAVVDGPNRTTVEGNVTEQYRLIGPARETRLIERYKIDNPRSAETWTKITDDAAARKAWDEAVGKLPEYSTMPMHLITGAVLPIWDRLSGNPRVVRLETDAGERFLGRIVPADSIGATLKALGASADAPKVTPTELMGRLTSGAKATLANGWTIERRTVAGEDRVEVRGPASYSEGKRLTDRGAFSERINYQNRYFVPTGADGVKVLERIVSDNPVLELTGGDKFSRFGDGYRSKITGTEQQKIADRIKRIAKQIAPGVNVNVFGEIISKDGTDVAGLYRPAQNLIEVALNYGDPDVSVRHEAIHALKNAGLFTDQEWSILEEKARRDWMKKHEITKAYPELDKTAQLEEAIAQGFGEYRAGEKTLPKFRRIFAKLRDFLTRVGNALRGMGYMSVDDIFTQVERGEVGRRTPETETAKDKPGSLAGFFNDGLTPDQERDENVKYSIAWLTKKTATPAPAATGSAKVNEIIDDIMTTRETSMPTAIREGISEYLAHRGARFKQAFLDRFASIGELEKDVSGDIRDASKSAYKAARVTSQLRSFVSYVLRHGPLEFYYEPKTAGQWVRPKQGWKHGGLEDMLRPLAQKGALKLWKGWMIAQRARRLDQEGRENLFKKVADQRGMTVDQLIDTIDREARAHPAFNEFIAAQRKWRALNKAMLDFAERGGLINAEQRATWEHSDYIPFYRVMEDMEIRGGRRGKRGIADQRSGIRQLKGGEAQVNDVVENMVLNITSLVDRSLKNVAMQRTIELARAAGIAKPARNQFGKAYVPLFWQPKDVQAGLAAAGWDMSMIPPDQRDGVVKLMQMTAPQGPDIASVMINGKAKYYQIDDPLLMEAVQAFQPHQVNGVLKLFRAAKTLLTRGVTLDPAFMVANAMRDTLHAWVVAGEDGFTPVLDSAKGFKSALREDETFRRMMGSGAGGGGYYTIDPDDVNKLVSREFKDTSGKGIINTGKDFAIKMFEGYERIGQATEYANRVAVYNGIRKSGGTEAEAAFRALDLLDYSMHGSSAAMQVAIQTLPFLNARIQGLARMVRGAQEHPQSFLLRGMLITGVSLALYAMNEDDERYESLEDWKKDIYWYLPIGNGILIPKPFEVGVLFGTLPERFARLVSGRDDTEDTWKAAGRALFDTFAINPIPQLARPMIEQWSNKVFFTQRPIVPRGLENLPDEMQFNAWTGETARAVGDLTGQSPTRIEHLVRGFFGSLGTYALGLSDYLVRQVGDYPDRPATKLTDFPVLRRFVMDETPRNSKYVEKFYEVRQEVTEIMNAARALQRWGKGDEARTYLASHATEVRGYKGLNKAAKALSQISLRMRQIASDPTMSADDKREELDMLTRRRNEIARIYSDYPATMQIINNVADDPDAAAKVRSISE